MHADDRNGAALVWTGVSLRGKVAALLFACVLVMAGIAAAPAADNVIERDDIRVTISEINEIIDAMDKQIAAATSALSDVESLSPDDSHAMTDEIHAGLEVKVNEVLEGLSPNSVLMDNMEGAKANMIVLLRWFERQPPDYPNRDNSIARLEEITQGYDELNDLITSGRQGAQEALRQLTRARFYQSMGRQIATAQESVEITRKLVESLKALSENIHDLARHNIPEAIPN